VSWNVLKLWRLYSTKPATCDDVMGFHITYISSPIPAPSPSASAAVDRGLSNTISTLAEQTLEYWLVRPIALRISIVSPHPDVLWQDDDQRWGKSRQGNYLPWPGITMHHWPESPVLSPSASVAMGESTVEWGRVRWW
jgi:hypothetical protein